MSLTDRLAVSPNKSNSSSASHILRIHPASGLIFRFFFLRRAYFGHHALMSQAAGRKVQTVVEKIVSVMRLESIVEGCF